MATYQNLTDFQGLKVGDIVEYTYTGVSVSITVRKGTYKITAYGGQGGYINARANGGRGGLAQGTWVNETKNRNAFICVGGEGNNGGFNGGGKRTTVDNYGGGGGASDIRLDVDDLYHRLIVGGGGGSDCKKGSSYGTGGVGGGTTGANSATYSATYGGEGGSQTAGGKTANSPANGATKGEFGVGGNGGWYSNQTTYNYGAGGGGWYGGGGAYRGSTSTSYVYAGGGGSGFAWTNQALTLPSGGVWGLTSADALTSTTLTQGGRTGNGLITIEMLALPQPYKLATDGTDTYGYTDPEWEVVIEDTDEPDAQDFLDYGVMDITTFDGLPSNCHLLIYDPEQEDKDYTLKITSNPTEQVITTKTGIVIPFATTAGEPSLTVQTSGGGTAVVTEWQQVGNKVSVEVTMTKPSMDAESSVQEIIVPFSKGS